MKKITLALFIIINTFLLNSQPMDIQKMWSEVDLKIDEAPKDALKIVEKIYNYSINQNDDDNLLRCYVYFIKCKIYEEDFFYEEYKRMTNYLTKAKEPTKSVLYQLLANILMEYYKNITINNTLPQSKIPDDIKEWTAYDYATVILNYLNKSVENKEILLKYKESDFPTAIVKGTKPDFLRPTLYDFLIAASIDLLSSNNIKLPVRPFDYFEINSLEFLTPLDNFLNYNITTTDTLSFGYHAFLFYKIWLQHLKSTNNIEGLADADLKRFSYFYENISNTEKDDIALETLDKMLKLYETAKYVKDFILVKKAQILQTIGNKYSYKVPNTFVYKDYLKKAVQLCDYIISEGTNEEAKNEALILKREITASQINLYLENNVPTAKNFTIGIEYSNIENVIISIYKITYNNYVNNTKEYFNKEKKNLIKTYKYSLKNSDDYQKHFSEVILEGLPQGHYAIVLESKQKKLEDTIIEKFQVTDIGVFYEERNGTVFVVDRNNGKPLPKVQVNILNYENKVIDKYTTDDNGICTINPPQNGSFYIEVIKDNQRFYFDYSIYFYKYSYSSSEQIEAFIITDRAIYRPGQKVHYKVIVFEKKPKGNWQLVTNSAIKIYFNDANYQNIATEDLKTNEFGSASGFFEIPQQTLNGLFSLRCLNSYSYIRVEEYKRPQFFVEINPPKQQYKINDKVKITGKAQNYNGAPLNNATVAYKVYRTKKRRWWWYDTQEKVLIASGLTFTDDKGNYQFEFLAKDDKTAQDKYTYLNFSIEVAVTDINGETQLANYSLNIGRIALFVNIDVKNNIDIEKKQLFDIYCTNVNNEPADATGQIVVYSLVSPTNPLKNKVFDIPDTSIYSEEQWRKLLPFYEYQNESNIENWKTDRLVYSTTFKTDANGKFTVDNLKLTKEGAYRIVVKTKDIWGNEIEETQNFVAYSSQSKNMPIPQLFWYDYESKDYSPNEVFKLFVGSSFNVDVLIQIAKKDTILTQKLISLNNSKTSIDIPISTRMYGGFSVNLITVVENKAFTESFSVSVPYTHKKLDFEYIYFKDNLLPGQKDKIILKIKNGSELTEILANAYDASLDDLAPYALPNLFNYFYPHNPITLRWGYKSGGISRQYAFFYNFEIKDFQQTFYSYLNLWDLNFYSFGRGKYLLLKSEKPTNGKKNGQPEALPVVPINKEAEVPSSADESQLQQIEIRKNFAETAFFFPQLIANKDGSVEFHFTLPEDLTKWHFVALAHTKDLKFGTTENYFVTQKPMMLMPNLPRFVRENDKLILEAKITNLSSEQLSGEAIIEFYDALTDKKLSLAENYSNKFEVSAQQSTTVKWTINIPEDIQAIKYIIYAKTYKYTDGISDILVVLPKKTLITETQPLWANAKSKKTFVFKELQNSHSKKTIKHKQIIVEYTPNPVWYVVEALPYLMEYPFECSEQVFNRFYANSLANYIINKFPSIEKTFEQWQQSQSDELTSNLLKNNEVKQVLATETPWFNDALAENTQKQNIAKYFDRKKINQELKNTLKKLLKMQLPSGGWPWFEGMKESWYITQYILSGFAQLSKIGVEIPNQNILSAVKFIDQQAVEYYNDLLKNQKINLNDFTPPYIIVNYVYTRLLYSNVKFEKESEKVFCFFYEKTIDNWKNYNYYGQAIIALSAYMKKNMDLATKIINSLKQKAIEKEEMGMYWKSSDEGMYWYQLPIETQSLLINAFYEITKDFESCNKMIIWLLKNKQTNNWKTTTATAYAVYTIVNLLGQEALTTDKFPVITIGSKIIDANTDVDLNKNAGSGYFKTYISEEEIKPQMATITVDNQTKTTNWGAVYWQYWIDFDEVTTSQNYAISITKELFIEQNNKFVAVDNSNIKVGDIITVRLTIRNDRPMEYVHVKDLRAACFEPVDVLSKYIWKNDLGFYQVTKDASTNFFIDYLPTGVHVIEYKLKVNNAGIFSDGMATVQCMYAPEFSAHSKAQKIIIK